MMRMLIVLSLLRLQTSVLRVAYAQMSDIKILILDKVTGKGLPGARINVGSNFVASSDEHGYATCVLPHGAQKVIITMLGYRTDTLTIQLPTQKNRISVPLTS